MHDLRIEAVAPRQEHHILAVGCPADDAIILDRLELAVVPGVVDRVIRQPPHPAAAAFS